MPTVQFRSGAGVATVTLDRPPVHAFSMAMWRELIEVLRRAGLDEDVRAVVLTATGERAFSAGADVREAAALGPGAAAERAELVLDGLTSLWEVPVPVVCALNGPAVGGGLNMATLCDYRIAAGTASFALPEIRHGRHGGGGAFLRRIGVPSGVVRAMLYTGRRLSADDALAAHLVDEVVEPEALAGAAAALAAEIAGHTRTALVATKRAVRAVETTTGWADGYRAADAAAPVVTGRG